MRPVRKGMLLVIALVLTAAAASAEELTVGSIATAQKAGASTDGIIAMVNDPANTVTMTADDLVTLRDTGAPDALISALRARISPPEVLPDDARLVDLVRLIKSGISESIVAEQVKQSGQTYQLSVNDLLYLKRNSVLESTIGTLMATSGAQPAMAPGAAAPAVMAAAKPEPAVAPLVPEPLVFDGLVLKTGFMRKNRPGRLVLEGNVLAWTDGADPEEKSFEFQTTGLEKVWFTCQARTPDNFCYRINFQIVKGARYEFEDVHRESGGNAAVLDVMAALRTHFPQVAYAAPTD